jgi:hypothetical protein
MNYDHEFFLYWFISDDRIYSATLIQMAVLGALYRILAKVPVY